MSSTTASRQGTERRAAGLGGLLAVCLALATLLLASCSGRPRQFAYTGRVDVDTITLSAQASGVIEALHVHAGDTVHKGELLGQINTDRLQAQRKQEMAQLSELDLRRVAAAAQITQAQAQLKLARETLAKTERLLAQGGATRQRRDELATQVQVDEANLATLQSNEKLISAQEEELRAGMEITDIAIREARVVSPIDGTVLNRYHYPGELAGIGTPLLELADLSVMYVEIYVPLSKLASISLGEKATVAIDGTSNRLPATIFWISSEAEFTPKTILTEQTRTALVYGVKIRVSNRGDVLKIGMPVDVQL